MSPGLSVELPHREGCDEFGQVVSASHETSVEVWQQAYGEMLGFRGDPFATLRDANGNDERFVMGPVFSAAYQLLGGLSPSAPEVMIEVDRCARRAPNVTEREQMHVAAATLLHAGEFLAAGEAWDAIARAFPTDFTAIRFAHDVCLHIGDDTTRLRTERRAIEVWPAGSRAAGLIAGLAAFSHEEAGRYDEAERLGRVALDVDPDDLWARHALAHVYESTKRHDELFALLLPTSDRWSLQTSLNNHVWWHVALSMLNVGEADAAIAMVDDHLLSSTAFGLADTTSMLWRAELAGVGVAGRWQTQADGWASKHLQWHTCGFLDMHAAMAFARVPEHPRADEFFAGFDAMPLGDESTFNAITFRHTVRALAFGLRAFGSGDRQKAAGILTAVLPTLHRIGGSVIQRDIITRTIAA